MEAGWFLTCRVSIPCRGPRVYTLPLALLETSLGLRVYTLPRALVKTRHLWAQGLGGLPGLASGAGSQGSGLGAGRPTMLAPGLNQAWATRAWGPTRAGSPTRLGGAMGWVLHWPLLIHWTHRFSSTAYPLSHWLGYPLASTQSTRSSVNHWESAWQAGKWSTG